MSLLRFLLHAALSVAFLVALPARCPHSVAADEIPLPSDTEGSPLPPAEALKRVTVPDGFKVSLFA